MIPQFETDCKTQVDTTAIDALAAHGGKFTLCNGKIPIGDGWQNIHYDQAAAIAHAESGRNVGLLTGAPSNNIICFDLDKLSFPKFLIKHDLTETYHFTRPNAPERGKAFVRCIDGLPQSTSWRPDPADKSPWAELLSTGRQAVIHGTNTADGIAINIEFHGDRLIELTLAQVGAIWEDLTSASVAAATPKPDKPRRLYPQNSNRERIERIKAAWPSALAVFQHHGLATEVVAAPRQNKRIKGQGGLLVGDPNGPNGWEWFNFSDWLGGDQIDAFGYCLYGRQWNRYNTTLFKQVMAEMERAAGIEPEPQRPEKTTVRDDTDKAQSEPGAPVETAAESPLPICGKWIRSRIKTNDGGYIITLTQGVCGRNNCAHCARVTDEEKYIRILKHIDVEGIAGTWALSVIDKGDYGKDTRARRGSKTRYVSLIGKNANRGKVLLLTEDPNGAATMDEIRAALASYLDRLPDLDAPPRTRLMRFSKGFFGKEEAANSEPAKAVVRPILRDQWGRSAEDYRYFIAQGGKTEQLKRWKRALADLEAETGETARHVEHVGEQEPIHAQRDDVPETLRPYLDRTAKISLDHQELKAILQQIGAKATYRGRYCYAKLTEEQALQWVELVYHATADQRRAA